MDRDEGGRFALITGCGKGSIGEALTREFLRHGLSVVSTVLPNEDRTHLDLPRCHVHECDVTDEKSVSKLHRYVEDLTGGRLHVLGNNAGIGYKFPAVDTDLDIAERLLAVHVLGTIRMVRHFHTLVIRTKGIIMNISSVSGVFPTPYSSVYGACKAAVCQYGNTLRVELAPFDVRVVTVLGGEVRTNITKPGLHRVIDEGSVYAPMQERFKAQLDGNHPKMTAHEFAKGVVKHVLGARPSSDFWYGALASRVKYMSWFLPRSVMEYVAYSRYHLDELKVS